MNLLSWRHSDQNVYEMFSKDIFLIFTHIMAAMLIKCFHDVCITLSHDVQKIFLWYFPNISCLNIIKMSVSPHAIHIKLISQKDIFYVFLWYYKDIFII